MARYTRMETLGLMKRIGVVPVFYHADPGVAVEIVRACVEGGARVVEFTNRGDRAAGVFAEVEAELAGSRPEAVFGVGSVMDAHTAAVYIGAGACFVVGPILDEDTARVCNARKIPYSPGCGTVTEIHRAHCLGVEICKVFPGDAVGGPGFVKAIRGPMPWTELMPTGGVEPTAESLRRWFAAGIACAGIGSRLITGELVAARDYAGITRKVRETVELIRGIRGS